MNDEISLQMSKILITKNEHSSTDTVVVFLPGLSGKAFSKRFQTLADVALAYGLPIARVHAWENVSDVESHTWSHYQSVLDEVVATLKEHGYVKIIAVGKSFGGGLLLSYQHQSILKKILWAPAIGVGEDATFESHKNDLLSDVASFLDLHLTPSFISADTAMIRIIHGTADESVPLKNSEAIVQSARNGKIILIDGADHSFRSEAEERNLMEATRTFLTTEN